MRRGGIVLCGGRSSRMGTAKLSLPFGNELMLQRIVRLLGEVCAPIVVVAADGQELPLLPGGTIIARDRHAGRGPLEGLLAGLRALPTEVDAAYVSGCDVPLLVPALVARMFELLGADSIAVAVSDGYQHPLAAVYRRTLVDVVEALLDRDQRRPSDLFDIVSTRRVAGHELCDLDPELATLKNLNTPEEYQAALKQAGFEVPQHFEKGGSDRT